MTAPKRPADKISPAHECAHCRKPVRRGVVVQPLRALIEAGLASNRWYHDACAQALGIEVDR